MKKLGPISLPQDYPGGLQSYSHRLSVMLYQYLRELAAQVNSLIDASSSGGGGGTTVVAGTATLTVPTDSYYHAESVTLTGCTTSMNIVCSLAPHADTDVNSEELLSVVALSADPGTNSATINITFSEPTTGAVKINMVAV